jgi:5-hydroxyisourate hydrolase-like protein (transthyretin family)
MKKVFLSLVACAVLFTSSFANEKNPDSKDRFAVLNAGDVVKVFYKGSSSSNVKIKIFNAEAQEVYSETIVKTDGFVRPYNISQLPQGNYRIEMTDGASEYRENITVSPARQPMFHVLPMKESAGKFLLLVAKVPNSEVTVTVYNRDGVQVHKQVNKANEDFAQVLNLEKINGEVTIHVADSNGTSKTYSFN